MAEFHAFLKTLRSARGFSIGQLAAYSGISKATLSRWEAGIHSPRIPELFQVLEVLEASSAMVREALGLLEQPRAVQAAKTSSGFSDYLSVGDLLRALRDRVGLSQQEAARLCGVYRTQYRNWENDDSRPSTQQLQTAAFMMGASPDEVQAISTMALCNVSVGNDRESLLEAFHSFFSWDAGFTKAMRELQLLTIYSSMLRLYRLGKASAGDLALIISEFGSVENIWTGSIAKREIYFARARYLAQQSHEPLNLHVVPALTGQSPEDLLAWSPAFASVEGKAYLMSHAARQLARSAPDSAIQLGESYQHMVENHPWEYPCRQRDFGNLLVDCGKADRAVEFISNLVVPDRSRKFMQYLDLAQAYLAADSRREAGTCLESALSMFPATEYGFVNRAIASIQARLS